MVISVRSTGCRVRRTAAVLACVLTATAALAVPAAGEGEPRTVAELTAALDEATRAAERAADDALAAASASFELRRRIDEATDRYADAQAALADRLRDLYINGPHDPITALLSGGATHQLSLLANVQQAGVRSEQQLVGDLRDEDRSLQSLKAQAATDRASLLRRARRVYALQDKARRLLDLAERSFVSDESALVTLAAKRAALDEQSAEVSTAVQPTVTTRGRRAAAAEAPIIAELEAAGSAFPPGYRATGVVMTGEASWYGPGFVGKPTATGAPYDPERFTAAMLAVPLGTVVRVTTADGRAVNVLVNDRGPYAGGDDRIIDMSAAGARMLGYTGVKQVRVEVLQRTG